MDEIKSTVLVVEDEELLLQAIARKLQGNQLKAIQCKTGRQALDKLNSLDKTPDLIWLDYYLKDMSGLEFMQILKENKKLSNIPTIVVSNSASPDKVKSMKALGIKKYYLKAEHKLDDIITTVKDILKKANAIKSNRKAKKILVVDDEILVIKALTEKLEPEGFSVDSAQDGEEALLKVKQTKPDLILLDIIMPKLDGISVLKRLKASPETDCIPVIILTNLYDDKKVNEALTSGGTEYLIKVEHTLDDILKRVKQKLQ